MREPDLDTVRLLRRAKDLIDREHAAELDVATVAAHVHLSPAHFARAFRATYGETPHQYLLTRRLERAAALLRQGIGVTEACMAVGFASLGSFSSRFREVYGETPSAYAGREHPPIERFAPYVVGQWSRPRRHPSRNEEAGPDGGS